MIINIVMNIQNILTSIIIFLLIQFLIC